MGTILVTGALGQIGSDLVPFLAEEYGAENIVASDVKDSTTLFPGIAYRKVDVTSREAISRVISNEKVSGIFHLAGILSASGEKNPELAYRVNLDGTFNVLSEAKKAGVQKVFIPSTIGVFGSSTPKKNTPVETVIRPSTMYGITKIASELLGEYFSKHLGLDVRGVRLPGIISYKTEPVAGTTDYSVEMFTHAIDGKPYACYLKRDTQLPMMYIDDALGAMLKLYESDPANLTRRTDYQLSAYSLTPGILADSIMKHIPDFEVTYSPDFRQKIAEMWPESVDCSLSAADWGFNPSYGIEETVEKMILNLRMVRDGKIAK